MSKFTAAKLVEFYQKVADGGVMELLISSGEEYLAHPEGPTFADNTEHWRIKPAKKKKIIDLQPLLNSGIDCEFSDDFEDWHIGGLIGIHTSSHNKRQFYEDYLESNWGHCRPRMDHKMFYNGEKPIEGFVVRVYFGGKSAILTGYVGDSYGPHVRAIEYLRVEDGYAYPWEK